MRRNKVGIITLHQVTNYGGILQAYALQHVICNLGYDVEVIEKSLFVKEPSAIKKVFLYVWRTFQKKVMHRKISIRKEKNQNEKFTQWYEAAEYTMPFINKHIHHRYIKSFEEIHCEDYFALVVGSDQIWRPIYTEDVDMRIEDAYLKFAKHMDIRRISYAPSFGSDVWEYTPKQTKECSELLSLFDAVSCREDSGTEFCKKYLNYSTAISVLDPTLLLKKEDYISLIGNYNEPLDGDLMCYVLDENDNVQKVIDYISTTKNYKPFSVKAKAKNCASTSLYDRKQPPVERWLKGFSEAKFIITDSFHACVFAIIFRKDFVVIANSDRGVARYKSLLSKFDLEYRLIYEYNSEKINNILGRPMIVDEEEFSRMQQQSMGYLQKSLLSQ